MKNQNIIKKEKKNTWISFTGYRILLEFQALLQQPRTIDELIDIVKNDKLCNKQLSKDTIRFDINTLRSAGCVISKPVKENDYKLQIISHPFGLNIKNDELDILIELRNNLSTNLPINEVFILNDLYDKIASLTFNTDVIESICNSKFFADVDRNIISEFLKPSIIGKKVQICYKSPKFGNENVDVIPLKVLYENSKIYLCAFNYKYNTNSYFEFSKIIKINSVSIEDAPFVSSSFSVIYEVYGESIQDFELKHYEKILEKYKDKIIIEADVSNEFMFIQRLFLLGKNFKIIKPNFFREKLIEKVKLIQKRYSNETD